MILFENLSHGDVLIEQNLNRHYLVKAKKIMFDSGLVKDGLIGVPALTRELAPMFIGKK